MSVTSFRLDVCGGTGGCAMTLSEGFVAFVDPATGALISVQSYGTEYRPFSPLDSSNICGCTYVTSVFCVLLAPLDAKRLYIDHRLAI